MKFTEFVLFWEFVPFDMDLLYVLCLLGGFWGFLYMSL
jgi:hypothetical protein